MCSSQEISLRCGLKTPPKRKCDAPANILILLPTNRPDKPDKQEKQTGWQGRLHMYADKPNSRKPSLMCSVMRELGCQYDGVSNVDQIASLQRGVEFDMSIGHCRMPPPPLSTRMYEYV